MDRIESVAICLKTLTRKKQENENNFRNEEYYKSFIRLVYVAKKIKHFIEDVSQIQGFKKYLQASSIKIKFNGLDKELETVTNELNFAMTIANGEQLRINIKDVSCL